MPRKLRLLATPLACLLAGPSIAWAQAPVSVPPSTIILARQAAMALSYGTVAGMKAAIQHGGPVKPWAEAAGSLEMWAELVPSMFPAGTEKGNDTKAKPAIWTDRAGFEKKAHAYADAARQLEAAARANDLTAFTAAFKSVGQACGACHKAYREKE